MSSKPIQVGDLVMVVRVTPCCGLCAKFIGHTFIVQRIYMYGRCSICNNTNNGGAQDEGRHWFILPTLKRIDPLAEPEHIETDEEIHA